MDWFQVAHHNRFTRLHAWWCRCLTFIYSSFFSYVRQVTLECSGGWEGEGYKGCRRLGGLVTLKMSASGCISPVSWTETVFVLLLRPVLYKIHLKKKKEILMQILHSFSFFGFFSTGPFRVTCGCGSHYGARDGPQLWHEPRRERLLPGQRWRWRLHHGCSYWVRDASDSAKSPGVTWKCNNLMFYIIYIWFYF